MTSPTRSRLNIRLQGGGERDGEIALSDIGKIAEQTQQLVLGLAEALTGRQVGRRPTALIDATRLYLVGVARGSTVLEIAGTESINDALKSDDMPGEIGDLALELLMEAATSLAGDDDQLPVGIDRRGAQILDRWLRDLRGYESLVIEGTIGGTPKPPTTLAPGAARQKLRGMEPQPSVPYLPSGQQALTGRLYALNLDTGSFTVRDDAAHAIRLAVPIDLRSEAAHLIGVRVRATGTPEVDNAGRLVGFRVAQIERAPNLDELRQGAFFERHELLAGSLTPDTNLQEWAIPDLSEDEIDGFVAATAD